MSSWVDDVRVLAVSLEERFRTAATAKSARTTILAAAGVTVALWLALSGTVGGLWASTWLASLWISGRLSLQAARWVKASDSAGPAPVFFCAAYAGYMIVCGTISLPLWLRPDRHGDVIATGLLAAGLIRAIFETRGTRAVLLGAVPQATFLVAAPLWAAFAGAASPPPVLYWLVVGVLAASSLAWGREIARLDLANAAALAEADHRRREAESATAAKSAFIAMVSHELRTPISGVLAASSDLEQADIPEVRERAALVADSARLMRTLLNDLLDLAKIDAGRMTVEATAFNPKDLLVQTAKFYELDAAKKGLELRLVGADAMPPQAIGDPTRLRQVLNNLLSNAIKFTDAGAVTLRADFEPSPTGGGTARLAVADTGRGIDPEGLARLFKPFVQTDASVARTHGGTGLGLSISRDLVRLMGGDLIAQSELGCGATFIATVQFGVANDENPQSLTEPADEGSALAGRRVLAVDDHDVNRRVLALMLEPAGMNVEFAVDGLQALERLAVEAFDVVLMDVQMPELDGRETTRRLRRRAGLNQDVPVVAVTGSGAEDDVAACLAAGMTAHIVKPLEATELYSALGLVLAARRIEPDDLAPSVQVTGQ